MQSDHIALGVKNEGNEAIFANRHFFLENAPAIFGSTSSFYRAVFTLEVNQRAAAAGRAAFHFSQCTCRAIALLGHRESPHFHLGAWYVLELALKDGLVKSLGTFHILYINFKPADGIGIHGVTP